MDISLAVPAFIAGTLTFLAPCTLPLVPGYVSFIGGVSREELRGAGNARSVRRKIFLNGIFYVIGFSAVFILLGSLFGLGGAALIQYRMALSRIGGVFIIFFGLYTMGLFRLPGFLSFERRLRVAGLTPGTPASAALFGATFAFGWTPCVGPVLGALLTLAASSATVAQGAFLLAIFSLGLAVPFLIVAAAYARASRVIARAATVFRVVSIVGGALLVVLGFFLITNRFGYWIALMYRVFNFLNYESILNYL